jgi:hypothetical protein
MFARMMAGSQATKRVPSLKVVRRQRAWRQGMPQHCFWHLFVLPSD